MKTYSLFFLTILFVLSALVSGCNQDEERANILPAQCASRATFQDFSGLGGCGFLLVMQNGQFEQVLEAVNLADFDIVPTEGMEVCIDFTDAIDAASSCMVGRLINVTSISPIDER